MLLPLPALSVRVYEAGRCTPERPNTFVPTRLVQEITDLEYGTWRVTGEPVIMTDTKMFVPAFLPNSIGAPPPLLDLRFSNLYAHQSGFHLFSGKTWIEGIDWGSISVNSCINWKMRDCNLSRGGIFVGPSWSYIHQIWGEGTVEWVNNLLERVELVLQPTYLSHEGGAKNVDLAFTAYNNLFRNQDFFLDPIPASAGGPFGNYYFFYSANPLPELYHPAKRGSRTPAQAGLFQYTTRADQTKDGSQSGNAIIGRHYVAAVNSYTAQPKGTDSDGIPDYVEDANGNGQWEEDLETKINAVYTTAGIHDSLNVIYDDVDLDGDGLIGRVEKALQRN